MAVRNLPRSGICPVSDALYLQVVQGVGDVRLQRLDGVVVVVRLDRVAVDQVGMKLPPEKPLARALSVDLTTRDAPS